MGSKSFPGNHDCDRVHGYDYLHMSGPVTEYEHSAGNCMPRQKSDRRWPLKYTFFGKSNFPPKARSLRKQSRISLRVGRSNSTGGAIWLLIYSHQENTHSSEDGSLQMVLSLAIFPLRAWWLSYAWPPQFTVLKSRFPILN